MWRRYRQPARKRPSHRFAGLGLILVPAKFNTAKSVRLFSEIQKPISEPDHGTYQHYRESTQDSFRGFSAHWHSSGLCAVQLPCRSTMSSGLFCSSFPPLFAYSGSPVHVITKRGCWPVMPAGNFMSRSKSQSLGQPEGSWQSFCLDHEMHSSCPGQAVDRQQNWCFVVSCMRSVERACRRNPFSQKTSICLVGFFAAEH